MKIINLNKFRIKNKVQIEDGEYEVYGMSVGDFIETDPIQEIDDVTDTKTKITKMVNLMCRYSNIPAAVLKKQPFAVLTAMILVIQGIDPTEQLESPEKVDEGEPLGK